MQSYHQKEVTFLGVTRRVYQKGSGPDVLILPEIPGLHQATFALSDRLIESGFRVHLLSLSLA